MENVPSKLSEITLKGTFTYCFTQRDFPVLKKRNFDKCRILGKSENIICHLLKKWVAKSCYLRILL